MKHTFSIGGVHPDDSKISASEAIQDFPLPETAYISMAQHLGAPAEPVVAKGDKVKAGDLLGKPSGFISAPVHSPYSGTVRSVEPVADISGNKVMTVILDIEGDSWNEAVDRNGEIVREIKLTPSEIIARIAGCGIVGLGGATFPTNVKLSVPPGKKAEYLLINGAECEPYITSGHRLMLEKPEEILIGTEIMMKALGLSKAYIGIEDNKKDAIGKLSSFRNTHPGIEIVSLKKKYPQGGEKQLIEAITGRRVPSMALPIDTGCVVQNVATAYAVYEAVQKNKPLVENVITITGECLDKQYNFRTRAGVMISEILDYIGGMPSDCDKVISGGPMMGKAVSNLSAPTLKGTSSLLLLTEKQTARESESNCIRCGKCIQACPMGLEPYLLNKLGRLEKYEELEQERVYDCIECGCCSFTCPSHIPLLDMIRLSKARVMKIMKSRPKK